jgi:hypothetical protein
MHNKIHKYLKFYKLFPKDNHSLHIYMFQYLNGYLIIIYFLVYTYRIP